MKLIIDIPKDVKAVIDRNGTNEIIAETLWQAVKNGILHETVTEFADRCRECGKMRKGHWIEHKCNGMSYIECSKCSTWFLRMYLTRNSYCPNCGYQMVDPQEQEKGEKRDTNRRL